MAKVFPLVTFTGWKPNAHIYRKVIAATEVTCGAILVFIPGKNGKGILIGIILVFILLMSNIYFW